ncbi:hypothetical protein ACWD4G_33430 [Streptomyces sp. NPDC002643]
MARTRTPTRALTRTRARSVFRRRALTVAVLTVLVASGLYVWASLPNELTYSSGARPLRTLRDTEWPDRPVYDHVWDVRRRVHSTFEVEEGFGSGEAVALAGRMRISVPEGCEDRTVRWELTADNEWIGQGRARWLREYDLPAQVGLHGRPATIGLTTWWDGGTTACPSYALTWVDPKVDREVDIDLPQPDLRQLELPHLDLPDVDVPYVGLPYADLQPWRGEGR